jgi:hypothetical protein
MATAQPPLRITNALVDARSPAVPVAFSDSLAPGGPQTDAARVHLTGAPGITVAAISASLVQDNVVVLSHRDREELELYGQKIVTYFHMTNTWARQKDGRWRLVATQVMAIPNERKPAAIDPKSLGAYVGQYRIAPQVTYTITREGDQLFGQRTGRGREELLPLCADVFYRKGVWRGEKVFERDARGQVVRMLDRRENNDLVWERVK